MRIIISLISSLLLLVILVLGCSKDDVISPIAGTPVLGTGAIDATWTFDKPHSNLTWETDYYDYSSTKLVGRFNNYNFTPKFAFNESDLSKCTINAWIQLSSFDSGEPGRDGPGKCARSYLGVTYQDTIKTIVDPLSDTAWFKSSSVVRSGTGYVVHGTFSFNRYRAPSGNPDGLRISQPAAMYVSYNGMMDFDTDGDGLTDRYRSSLTGSFAFKRSDHMDTLSTIQWVPVPSPADQVGNVLAANNKTYGVWTKVVADEMRVTLNMQFYKNH